MVLVVAWRTKRYWCGRLLGAVLLALAAASCVSFTLRHEEVYQRLLMEGPASALQALETSNRRYRDRVLYELDKAMLLRLTGDYAASNASFESAKETIQTLSATSITENITAVAINEDTRSYVGQPYEQLLLYAYKTLNYLAMGDVGGARVEVLQADAKMREWASMSEWEGINASVFMRYLSGIVFELTGEWNDALIAYRKAYEVLQENSMQTPYYLQRDLLRLTQRVGLNEEFNHYRRDFPEMASSGFQLEPDQAELIVIYHQGLVSRMFTQSISNFSPDISQYVRIAVPVYPLEIPWITKARIGIGNEFHETAVLEDIDQLARRNLAARMPGIMARAMIRVVAKKQAAHNAGKDDAFAGFIVELAGQLTEQADTRSWTSLPATIQIARITVMSGEHQLTVSAMESKGLNRRLEYQQNVVLAPQQKAVISVHDLAIQRGH